MKRKSQNRTEINIGQYNFEEVESFTYLGEKYINSTKQQKKCIRGLWNETAYYANLKLKKLSLLSEQLKIKKLYNTVETWIITTDNEHTLRVFKGKVIRRMYGPTKNKGERGGRINPRINQETEELLNMKDMVRYVKARRIA